MIRPDINDVYRTIMLLRASREPIEAMEEQSQQVSHELPYVYPMDDLMRNSYDYLEGRDQIAYANQNVRDAYREMMYQRYADMMNEYEQ